MFALQAIISQLHIKQYGNKPLNMERGTPFKVIFTSFENEDEWDWDKQDVSIPERFNIISVTGIVDPGDFKFWQLMDLLQSNSRKWEKISIGERSPRSPHSFLSILIAAIGKTKALDFQESLTDPIAYACLHSSIKLPSNGLEALYFSDYDAPPLSRQAATLLADAISSATLLKDLMLPDKLNTKGVGAVLIEGLKTNSTLERLCIRDGLLEDGVLEKLIAALQHHQTLVELYVTVSTQISKREMGTLGAWLGREECKLKRLTFGQRGNISYKMPRYSECCMLALSNSSLQHLVLSESGIDSSCLRSFSSKFTCLQSLNLEGNVISDLSPLDGILCGDGRTLQSLDLSWNQIGSSDIQLFARKLPQMKTLRNLVLHSNPFLKEDRMHELCNALAGNSSLERINLYSPFHIVAPEVDSHIQYIPAVNRGGRRGILIESRASLPVNLWPLILERACTICTYSWDDDWKSPTSRSMGADIVFCLFQVLLGS